MIKVLIGGCSRGMGALLVIMGIAAIIWPVMAGLVSMIYLGITLLIAGIAELAQSYKIDGGYNKFFWLFFGVITAIFGIAIGIHPLVGVSYIVAFMAAYFLIDGALKILAVFTKNEHKIWYAFNGIMSLILGYLVLSILIKQPLSADWILGTFIGINLIFKGFMIIEINSKNMMMK